MINTDQAARTTELAFVAGAQHVALGGIHRRGRGRQGRRTVAFLPILDTGVGHRGRRRRAERHAGLDRHTRRIDITRSTQQSSLNLVIAPLGHVPTRGLDGRGGHIERVVEDRDTGRATADFGRVAGAGHGAAGLTDSGVGAQTVAAETFLAEFETGEAVVVFRAEGLAGFEGHGRGVGVGGGGEGARVGFVGAAEVGPAVGCLAGGGEVGLGRCGG